MDDDNNYTKILESQNELLRKKIEEHETVRGILCNKVCVRKIDDFLTSLAHNHAAGMMHLPHDFYLNEEEYKLVKEYLSIGDPWIGKNAKELHEMNKQNLG